VSTPGSVTDLGAIDATTQVLVLRRSFAALQHGALGVARSAGRLGIPVHAVRMNEREPATRSRFIRRGLVAGADVPRAGASDREWLEALLALPPELGRPLLLPIDDVSAVFVGDHQERLHERFVLPEQPPGIQRLLASKHDLWELCERLEIPAPRSTVPSNEQEAIVQATAHGYPIVLKRSDPWLAPRDPSAPSVLIAQTRAELVQAYRRMESDVRAQVLLQDYIPGGSDSIWMFNGYFDGDSECLCAFTGRKLRQRGPRTGPTTLGVCVRNEAVMSAAGRLMRELGYRGIVDMGFRYDRRDGSYRLLDVNPRLGGSFRLFVAENGLDVVRAAYLDLTGQPVPRSAARDGRKWIVEPFDLLTAAQIGNDGELSPSDWLRSLRHVEEAAWWAADDPAPFLAMCATLGLRTARYLASRRARSSAAGDIPPHAELDAGARKAA
jgi:D-aspartate ligase